MTLAERTQDLDGTGDADHTRADAPRPIAGREISGLSARDVVHVATCVHEGITEIVSPDRGFDQVAEVRRIDPAAFAVEPA